MPKVCPICEKKAGSRNQYLKLMSKYNPAPKKKKHVNLQWVSVPASARDSFKKFAGKRIKACTGCIKTLAKKI